MSNVRELPQHQPTRLITNPNDPRVPTQDWTTDATTGLTRGIAEYVASLMLPASSTPAFVDVYDAWAEPEELTDRPAFIAYTNDVDGEYEAVNLTGSVSPERYPNGMYEVSNSALAVDIKCEIWATNPIERALLCGLVEQAFHPVEWMSGFRLELPHYFNQRATYLPGRMTYTGGAEEARQRFVNARMIVRGAVPLTRVLPFVEAKAPVVRENQVTTGALILPPGKIIRGR